MFQWWREGDAKARRALVAAALGWMLDSFDVMLYALAVQGVMADLSIDAAHGGRLQSYTLFASAAGVLRLVRHLRTEVGAAVLHITHDMALAASNCDRVAVLHAGRLVEAGSTAAVSAARTHEPIRHPLSGPRSASPRKPREPDQ